MDSAIKIAIAPRTRDAKWLFHCLWEILGCVVMMIELSDMLFMRLLSMKLFTLLVFIGALWLHSGQWNFHFIGVLGSWNIGCCMLFICDCYLCCTLVAFWQWKFSLYWCFGSWNIGCCTQLPVGGTLWSPNKYWWLLVILMKENENCMNLWALVWIKCRFKRCYFWITANMTGI